MNEASQPAATIASDLSQLDVAEQTGILEIKNNRGEIMRHPDGRPFTIELYSKDSAIFVNAARAKADRRIQANLRQNVPVMTAVGEKDAIELLAIATKRWDILLDGKQPPSTKEAYVDAYTRLPALMEQVDQFIGARANFMRG